MHARISLVWYRVVSHSCPFHYSTVPPFHYSIPPFHCSIPPFHVPVNLDTRHGTAISQDSCSLACIIDNHQVLSAVHTPAVQLLSAKSSLFVCRLLPVQNYGGWIVSKVQSLFWRRVNSLRRGVVSIGGGAFQLEDTTSCGGGVRFDLEEGV